MYQKHLFRICIVLTAVITLFAFFHAFLQWETVLNQKVSLTLPAAVYVSPDENLQFSYADMFHISVAYLEGSELEYHVDLLTDCINIHGYVEIWNYDSSLSIFLEKAKASFSPTVKNFQETFPDTTYNKRIWEYDIAKGIHVKQYFSQQEGKILVVALFAPQSLWSEAYDAMFEEIRNSITLT